MRSRGCCLRGSTVNQMRSSYVAKRSPLHEVDEMGTDEIWAGSVRIRLGWIGFRLGSSGGKEWL